MTPKQIAEMLDIRINSTTFPNRDVVVAFFGRREDQLAFQVLCAEQTQIPVYNHRSDTGDAHMKYYSTWEE